MICVDQDMARRALEDFLVWKHGLVKVSRLISSLTHKSSQLLHLLAFGLTLSTWGRLIPPSTTHSLNILPCICATFHIFARYDLLIEVSGGYLQKYGVVLRIILSSPYRYLLAPFICISIVNWRMLRRLISCVYLLLLLLMLLKLLTSHVGVRVSVSVLDISVAIRGQYLLQASYRVKLWFGQD